MDVAGQFIIADLDKSKSMFDFSVQFYILNPANSWVQAYYFFDKNSKVPKGVDPDKLPKEQIEVYEGQLTPPDVHTGMPFKYDTLTEKGAAVWVDAQVGLASVSKKTGKFKITVQLTKKTSHSVDITFQGDKPSWLPHDGSMFPGKLMLGEVKNWLAKKKP